MGVGGRLEIKHYSHKVTSPTPAFFSLPLKDQNDHFVFKPILIF